LCCSVLLDEIESLDDDNRAAILSEAKRLGFIAVTAAPKAVSEVDAFILCNHKTEDHFAKTPSHGGETLWDNLTSMIRQAQSEAKLRTLLASGGLPASACGQAFVALIDPLVAGVCWSGSKAGGPPASCEGRVSVE